MRQFFLIILFIMLTVQLFSMTGLSEKIDSKKLIYINVNETKMKTFKEPEQKLVKWIHYKDSSETRKFYGSILIKSKGSEGVAWYFIRIWDGEKYHYNRVQRSEIKSGSTIFSMKTKNGLTYVVKCPENSIVHKRLKVEIFGKVLHPDHIY